MPSPKAFLKTIKETLSRIRMRGPGSLQIPFKYSFPSRYFLNILFRPKCFQISFFRPEFIRFLPATAATYGCHFVIDMHTSDFKKCRLTFFSSVTLSMIYLRTKTAYTLPRIPFGRITTGLYIFTDVKKRPKNFLEVRPN